MRTSKNSSKNSMKAVVVIKPNSLSADDKAKLEKAGAIVIETDNPEGVNWIRL